MVIKKVMVGNSGMSKEKQESIRAVIFDHQDALFNIFQFQAALKSVILSLYMKYIEYCLWLAVNVPTVVALAAAVTEADLPMAAPVVDLASDFMVAARTCLAEGLGMAALIGMYLDELGRAESNQGNNEEE